MKKEKRTSCEKTDDPNREGIGLNLCQVSEGQLCRVRQVVCKDASGGRLAELGICRGSLLRLLSVGPGGVRIVRIRGMRLALGRQTAAGIRVARVGEIGGIDRENGREAKR
ncbi:MAG: ferrous iron transport protein A [Eubacteriales bacterium]